MAICIFETLWGTYGGATYTVHQRLIVNHIVDFLLVITELFFGRCYGWGATSEYQLHIGIFAQTGSVWPL